jgi:RNA polymerase sigma factor (sigma-70 family)
MTSAIGSHVRAALTPDTRNELALSHLTEVQFIARRIHGPLSAFVPLEDLVHSGVLGLMEAIDKYDSEKNIQFKTFAQFRIKGAIFDSLRQLDRASRASPLQKSKVKVRLSTTLNETEPSTHGRRNRTLSWTGRDGVEKARRHSPRT